VPLEPVLPGEVDPAGVWLVAEVSVGAGDADMVPPPEVGFIEAMPPWVVVGEGGVFPEDIPGAVLVGVAVDELSGAGAAVEV
jgi:hypothetical protein